MKRTWMLKLVLLASVGAGTAANATEPTGNILQVSDDDLGGSCRDICTESTRCIQKCVDDNGELLTCSAYGVCARSRPPCQYVPTTRPRTCHIDQDNHIWGNTFERHEETYYEDVDRKPECPGQWRTRIADRVQCLITTPAAQCCNDYFGRDLCTLFALNNCHA